MAFDYYSPVVIKPGQVPSAQTDFPVLISVTDARFKSVANGGHCKTPFDIRPYEDSGLSIPITGYELERYNDSTGEVIMNVKRSSVVDGLITYLAYGDASLNTDGSSATTWSNSFQGVYHLGDGTILNVSDSTGLHVGTNHLCTATTGRINGGAAFASASSQYIDLFTVSSVSPVALTYSVWVNATSFPNAYNAAIFKNETNTFFWGILVRNDGKLFCAIRTSSQITYDGTGSHTLLTGTWYYLTLTYNNISGLIGYVNAAQDGAVAANGNSVNGAFTTLLGNDSPNGRFWNGKMDEARVSSVARSPDWITTEYNQAFPATFETLGDEVSTTPVPPTPPEPVIIVPGDEHRGGARGWKKRLLEEKLWMYKQDEMLLKIANEDDLEVVHVLTDFLSRN